MDFKIYIRTTGQRELHKSIKQELTDKGYDYTLLLDYQYKPVDSFIEQLEMISQDNALLLEDDVILCKNFIMHVEAAIKEWNGKIINFFNKPFDFYTTHLETGHFCYNQCTYYPKGMGSIISNKMKELRIKHPNRQYDVLEKSAMIINNIPYVNYRPCLVQHIDYSSLIQSTHVVRRTIYFKDYLDELRIDMNEAYEYIRELKDILEREFSK